MSFHRDSWPGVWSISHVFVTPRNSEVQIDHIRIKTACRGCHARCCAMDTVLYPEEVALYDHVPHPRPRIEGEGLLRKNPETGLCVYSVEGKCSIYDRRPKSCRQWTCDESGGPDYIWALLKPKDAPQKPGTCPSCGDTKRVTGTDQSTGMLVKDPCQVCRPGPTFGLLEPSSPKDKAEIQQIVDMIK